MHIVHQDQEAELTKERFHPQLRRSLRIKIPQSSQVQPSGPKRSKIAKRIVELRINPLSFHLPRRTRFGRTLDRHVRVPATDVVESEVRCHRPEDGRVVV